MFQSTLIIDPKTELKGKQSPDTFLLQPLTPPRGKHPIISIDAVKEAVSWSAKTSFSGNRKIIVIEQLHKASHDAPQALLKLLEDPPTDTHIVMTANQIEAVIPTIISRSAVVSIHEVTNQQLEEWQLARQVVKIKPVGISWQDLRNQTTLERLQWLSNFAKGKKDVAAQLTRWQTEISQELVTASPSQKVALIKQLGWLEDEQIALKSHVLPRLILLHLHLRLENRG